MLRTHENKRPLTAPREQETADRPEGGAGGDLSSSAHHFRVICQLRRDSADRDSAETEFTECSCADGWRSPVSTVTASQPASLVVSAATAPAAHETEPAGRLEGGRRGVRAHHFRVTHINSPVTERDPPARPTSAAATPPPCLLLMNTHSSRYTRTKHHCHNTTRRHRPISCSCLLPSCHCCHRAAASPCALLPGDNIPHTPHARRLAPPPLPPPTPWIAPTLAHALPHALRLSCLPVPPTATPLEIRLTVADRNSQFIAGAAGRLRCCRWAPAPQGLRLILGLAPGGGVPNANALCWRSARSPFLSSPPRASGTRSHRRQPRARRSTQRGWHQARGVPGSKAPAHWRSILARTVPHAPRRHARSETWLGASAAAVAATAGSDGSCRTTAMAVTSPAVARAAAAAATAAAAAVAHAMAAATRPLPWPRPRLPQLLPWRMQQLQPRLRQQLPWRGSNGRSDGSCCGCFAAHATAQLLWRMQRPLARL
jgi:hypothetical protein